MRTPLLAAALAASVLFAARSVATAEDPPANAPKPPTTALPAFEDPLFDAEVGETCLYRVRDLEGKRSSWFEERVIARTAVKVLIETILTDETGTKNYQVEAQSSRWIKVAKEFPAELIPGAKWKKELQRDEIVYCGPDDALKAVRATRRVLDLPKRPEDGPGATHEIQFWHSHDVAGRGIAKRYPAQHDGERRAIAWTKRLPPEECKKRAGRYPTADEHDKAEAAAAAAAMDEPGMDEPGMGEPGMEPAGMDEPGMKEPGMDEPGMN